ncbi:hypothetical protein D3C75_953410 [compost metagenome]
MFGFESTSTQNTYGMVVAQNKILNRLVGVFPKLLQPSVGRSRGCTRIEANEKIFTLDGPNVWVTLSGQCINTVSDHFQRFDFFNSIIG